MSIFFHFVLIFPLVFSVQFTFGVISDTHIGENHKRAEYLEEVVKALNEMVVVKKLSFIVITGDVTHQGERSEFEKAKSVLDRLKVPYYLIVGEHDVQVNPNGQLYFFDVFGDYLKVHTKYYTGDVPTFDDSSSSFRTLYLQNYQFSHNGTYFLTLDFNRRVIDPYPNKRNVKVHNSTLEWLRKRLEELNTTAVKEVVLLHHIPFMAPSFVFGSQEVFNLRWDFSIEERKLIRQVMEESIDTAKIYGLFSGHFNIQSNERPFSTAMPTFNQWTTKACSIDSSYILVSVNSRGKIYNIEQHNARVFFTSFVIVEIVGAAIYVIYLAFNIYLLPIETKSYVPISGIIFGTGYGFLLEYFQANYFYVTYEQGFFEEYINVGSGIPLIVAMYFSILLTSVMATVDFYFPNHDMHKTLKTFVKPLADSLMFSILYSGLFLVAKECGVWVDQDVVIDEWIVKDKYISLFFFLSIAIFVYSFFVRLLDRIIKSFMKKKISESYDLVMNASKINALEEDEEKYRKARGYDFDLQNPALTEDTLLLPEDRKSSEEEENKQAPVQMYWEAMKEFFVSERTWFSVAQVLIPLISSLICLPVLFVAFFGWKYFLALIAYILGFIFKADMDAILTVLDWVLSILVLGVGILFTAAAYVSMVVKRVFKKKGKHFGDVNFLHNLFFWAVLFLNLWFIVCTVIEGGDFVNILVDAGMTIIMLLWLLLPFLLHSKKVFKKFRELRQRLNQ